MKTFVLRAFVGLALSAPILCAQANPPGSADQLQQLTAQLRQSPNNQALREKIIALALTISPKPATPDEAIMAEGAAEYAFKNAKANSDYSDAAKQYEKALVLAPWLAADYFNCGVAHEKAGENKQAIQNFGLYLLAAPNADDSVAVKKRMGALQYTEQKRDSIEAAREAEARSQAEEAARRDAEVRIGSHRGGGIIFYIDGTGQHGLITSPSDLGAGSWYQAVQRCKDYRGGGNSDWFLPSIEQLQVLYTQRAVVGGFGESSSGGKGFWSSTEKTPGKPAYNGVAILFLIAGQVVINDQTTPDTSNNDKSTFVWAIRAF